TSRSHGSRLSLRSAGMTSSPGSPKRRRDQQPAVSPPSVLSSAQTEPRLLAEMALEDVAVIADLLDRLIGPIGREPVLLAKIVADPEQALYLRHLALLHLLDIGLRDAQFLGGDQREEGPAHDVRPLAVVLPHERTDRLLGDDLGQDHVRVAVLQLQAARGERRAVVGPRIATALVVGVARLVEVLERDDAVIHFARTEIVRDVELGGRALRDADRGALEVVDALHVHRL